MDGGEVWKVVVLEVWKEEGEEEGEQMVVEVLKGEEEGSIVGECRAVSKCLV